MNTALDTVALRAILGATGTGRSGVLGLEITPQIGMTGFEFGAGSLGKGRQSRRRMKLEERDTLAIQGLDPRQIAIAVEDPVEDCQTFKNKPLDSGVLPFLGTAGPSSGGEASLLPRVVDRPNRANDMEVSSRYER
jgi:hypothetical protein